MTKNRLHKALSLFLALVMCVSLIPWEITARAASALSPVAAGLEAVRDYQDGQQAGKASNYYEYVYYGGLQWRVLDGEADSGNGTGMLLLSEKALGDVFPMHAHYYGIYPGSKDYNSTTKGYLALDVRKYLTGQGTYTPFQTCRAINDKELYPAEWKNSNYYRSVIADDPNNANDEFDHGPQPGVQYYVIDQENYIEETETLTDETFALGAYYTKDSGNTDPENTFVPGTTYYYDASTYKEWDSAGKDKFDSGQVYYRFYLYTEDNLNTYGFVPIMGTRYYNGYRKGYTTGVISGRSAAHENFANDYGISNAEQAAVLPATKSGVPAHKITAETTYSSPLDDDTYFLLSAEEGFSPEYGFGVKGNRIAKTTGGSARPWMLRTAYRDYLYVGAMSSSGTLARIKGNAPSSRLRPAFYLNPAAVLFVSEAGTGGKAGATSSTFSAFASAATQRWKLTLRDSTLSVDASAAAVNGNTVDVDYSGASATGENVWLSAIVTDGAGKQIYGYTKLEKIDVPGKQAGRTQLTLPTALVNGVETQLTPDNCRIQVFLERCGGAQETDYASKPVVLNVPQCENAEHVWSEWELPEEVSCTEGYTKTRYCLFCGTEESETVAPAGHDPVCHVQVNAKCEDGECGIGEYWECTVCGRLFKDAACTEEVANLSALVIYPTHETVKEYHVASDPHFHYASKVCVNCGNTIEVNNGRTKWSVHTGVTCAEGGVCTTCGAEVPAGHAINTINSTSLIRYSVAPTCTEPGVGVYRCLLCGEEVDGIEVPELGHMWSGRVKVRTETYDLDGLNYRYCTRCGETDITEVPLNRLPATIVITGPESFVNETGAPVTATPDDSGTFRFDHYAVDERGATTEATGLLPEGVNYNATIRWYKHEATGARYEWDHAPSTPGTYSLGISASIANTTEVDDNGNPVHSYLATEEVFFDFEILAPSGENLITAFEVPGQVGESAINHGQGTIVFTMPYNTSDEDMRALAPSTVSVSDNATLIEPADPETARDYFNSPSGVKYVVRAQDGSEKTYWVSAVRESADRTVSFETYGGSTHRSRPVTIGETYGGEQDSEGYDHALPVPTKEGFVFEGWYLEDGEQPGTVFATLIDNDSVVTVTTDHTLYAKWRELKTIVPVGTNVEYDYDGNPHPYFPKAQIYGTDPAEYVEADADTMNGFVVTYTDASGQTTDTAPSAVGVYDVTYTRAADDVYRAMTPDGTAKLTIKYSHYYTVTYQDGLDGDVFEDQVFTDVAPDSPTPPFDGEIPPREGYVFAGWQPEVAATVTADATYVAQWKADDNGDGVADERQVFVEYVSADETKGTVTGETEVFTAEEGESWVTVRTTAEGVTATPKTGYQLENWTNSENDNTNTTGAFAFGAVHVGTTITVTANWSRAAQTLTPVSEEQTRIYDGTPKHYLPKASVDRSNPVEYVQASEDDANGFRVEYKGANDAAYTTTAPSAIGTYSVRFSRSADNTYAAMDGGTGTLVIEAGTHYTVTYSDGENNAVFPEQKYEDLNPDSPTPPFDGEIPPREGYVFAGWQPEVAATVTADATYVAQWKADDNGDGIADDCQIFVEYVSADETKGTVTGATEVFSGEKNGDVIEVVTTARDVTATPAEGYVLDCWTNSKNNDTSADGRFDLGLIRAAGQTITVTAQWTADENNDGTPDEYQVFVQYVSESDDKGTVTPVNAAEVYTAAMNEDGSYKTVVNLTTAGAAAQAGSHYAFDRFTNSFDGQTDYDDGVFKLMNVPVGTTVTVTAHFSQDSNNDGTPDEYQVFVQYVSESDDKGTVTPVNAAEVYTAAMNEDGSYKTVVNLTTAGAAAQAGSHYAFDRFTNSFDGQTDYDDGVFKLMNVPVGTTVTVTAHFSQDSNNDGTPDRYQVFVQYVSESTAKGTVSGNTEQVFSAEQKEDGSYEAYADVNTQAVTATGKDGYALDRFTNDYNSTVSMDGVLNLASVPVGRTITVTARFAADQYGPDGETGDGIADKYQVIVLYEVDAPDQGKIVDGARTAEAFTADKKDDGTYKDVATFTTSGSEAEPLDPAAAALQYWYTSNDSQRNGNGRFTMMAETGTTVRVIAKFAEDSFGPDTDGDGNPDPNGVPDVCEAFVQYVAGVGGTLEGNPFYTFSKKTDGLYETAVTVDMNAADPAVNVTPVANSGYVFVNFTCDASANPSDDGLFNLGLQETNQTITITANFAEDKNGDGIPDTRQVLIQYVTDGNGALVDEDDVYDAFNAKTYNGGTGIADQVDNVVSKGRAVEANPKMALDKWTEDYTETESWTGIIDFGSVDVGTLITLTAVFAPDENEDDVPDKYQVLIHYVMDDVDHGTVAGAEYEAIYERDPETLDYAQTVAVTTSGNTVTPKTGWALDYWTNDVNDDTDYEGVFELGMQEVGRTITLTAVMAEDVDGDNTPDKYQVLIQYVSSDETKGEITGATYESFTADKTADGSYASYVSNVRSSGTQVQSAAGYAVDKWTEDYNQPNTSNDNGRFNFGTVETGTVITITVSFDEDDDQSGIPDKYELTVTYKIVNGKWANGSDRMDCTLVKLDRNGNRDANGTAVLGNTLPTSREIVPDRGYQKSGTWNPSATARTAVSEDTVFTLTLKKAESVTPITTAYTLCYESNGGTEYPDERYSAGTLVRLNKRPVREGYTFNGWYADAALTEPITEIIMNGDRMVYAGWTQTGTGSGTTPAGNTDCPRDNTCPLAPFKDLDMHAWYHDGIHYCLEKHLMEGVGNGYFQPSGNVSRAQIVTILWRMEGKPAAGKNVFTDVVKGSWYDAAVAWAAGNGIVEGYGNGKFGPNDSITREQFAAILYRYAAFKGYDISKQANLGAYADAKEISSWAASAMGWANANGLITGVTTRTLEPRGTATRAQAAAIIQRFCQNLAK